MSSKTVEEKSNSDNNLNSDKKPESKATTMLHKECNGSSNGEINGKKAELSELLSSIPALVMNKKGEKVLDYLKSSCSGCTCGRQSSASPSHSSCKKSPSPSVCSHHSKKHMHSSHHHHHHHAMMNEGHGSRRHTCNHTQSSKHSHESSGDPCILHGNGKEHSQDSKKQPSNNIHSHKSSQEDDEDDDFEDCEDDYEDSTDDEDEDCDDDSECDSFSEDDRSSASGHTRGDGRVCDCCYCEVFGHGMPSFMSQSSRNFTEMRDRLRQELSKRKAAKGCPETNMDTGELALLQNYKEGSTKGSVSPHRPKQEDNRNLEDLVNFIEGPKKKKPAKAVKQPEKTSKRQKKNENLPPPTAASSSSKKNDQNGHLSVPSKDDSKGKSKNTEQSNGSSSSSKSGHKENQSSNVSPSTSTANSKDKNKKTINGLKTNIPAVVVKSTSCSPSRTPSDPKNGTNKTIITKKVDEPQRPQSSNGVQATNGSIKKENKKKANKKEMKMQGKQNGIKSDVVEVVSPDEVFKPKDVNLENGELDPVEKELEAFKR